MVLRRWRGLRGSSTTTCSPKALSVQSVHPQGELIEVTFRTERLRRNYEESTRAIRQWGHEVARKYIIRVKQLQALTDFQAAYSVRSMRLHPLKGSKKEELAINLTGKWRLIVTKGDSEEHVIVQEVSDHYDD